MPGLNSSGGLLGPVAEPGISVSEKDIGNPGVVYVRTGQTVTDLFELLDVGTD